MKSRFRLQTVLEYRGRIVEALEVALAGLRAEERDAETRLAELYSQQQQVIAAMRMHQSGELDLLIIRQLQRNWMIFKSSIEQQVQRLADLQEAVNAKRLELLEAVKEHDVLLKLKERHANAWQAELNRQELNERDDQYIARAYHGVHT